MVSSIANGIISVEGYDSRAGNYIVIQHGSGIESIYCHLRKFFRKPGDLVFAGDSIAISGATGEVTAPHLHFAIKKDGKFTFVISDDFPRILLCQTIKRIFETQRVKVFSQISSLTCRKL